MDDLVPPQIKDSCKVALPNGLKELMSDISREVLRYQPKDLYKFITDYLAAMLITRENMTIASHICKDISNCRCEVELETELRQIGVPEADIETAKNIIVNYFAKDHVKESSLLRKLVSKTSIDEDMLPAVQEAIRNAFIRRQAQKSKIFETSSGSETDSVKCAAKHTMELYKQAASADEIKYEIMTQKIQNTYRAYGVRRDCKLGKRKETKPADHVGNLVDPTLVPPLRPFETAYPKPTLSEETMSGTSTNWTEDPDVQLSTIMNQKRLMTISSLSVAGSFLTLPAHRPYSVHDDVLSHLEENPEREHACIDYTSQNPHLSIVSENKPFYTPEKVDPKDIKSMEKYGAPNNFDFEVSIDNDVSSDDLFYRPDDMSYDGDTEIGHSDGNDENEVKCTVKH